MSLLLQAVGRASNPLTAAIQDMRISLGAWAGSIPTGFEGTGMKLASGMGLSSSLGKQTKIIIYL
jgi:hypothetical protein